GRDFWRTGVSAMHGGNDYMHLDETTFAEIFKQNGYTTGMWGKWHSGKSDGYWPWDRGFDEAYYAKLYNYFPSNGWFNQYPQKTTHEGEWSPKVLVDYTIDFIDRNKQKPFLAYLSFLTCHDIWNAPETYVSKYRTEGRTERFATLLGMLEFMDEQVGRLIQFLSDNGLDENTVVLFMSDNGPNLGDTNSEEWALRNNHGFLGNKARLWQNGLKSPLYIRWKGNYLPMNINRLVTVTDIFPTILDIANIPVPNDNLPIDGRSFKTYLEGDTTTLNEKSAIFSHWYPGGVSNQFAPIQPNEKAAFSFDIQKITTINERYKLLLNPVNVNGSPAKTDNLVLIDLKTDPLERTNVAQQNPNIVEAMKQDVENWFNEIKNEKHSFTSPVFQIGWKGKTQSEVRGFGPCKTVGCQNDSHKLKGLDAVGDYAEYKLNVHRSGLYKVTLGTSNKNMDGVVIKASSNSGSTKKELKNAWTQEIVEIFLEAGHQIFKIEVDEINASGERGIQELKAINFEITGESLGLSDSLATKETAMLFNNLKKIGKRGFLFGQHLACYEAQNWKDNQIKTDFNSDCYEAVGDHPAVFGFDFGRGITLFKNYCEEIYRRGGVSTYSWHAKNPVTGGNYNDTSGNPVTAILSGGEIHQKWINELDKIADFFNSLEVDGEMVPIIFRPFHENTGGWFWWGTGNCTNQEYIDLWRLTIDYLRKEKGVHNILVAYSPSKPSLNKSLAEAMYPGDEYVDIIGFDAYQKDVELKTLIRDNSRLVSAWAEEKNKVAAITEFGIRQGLQNSTSSDFFMEGFLNQFKNDEVGKNISYVLTWMNISSDSYWTPLQGQPNYESFVNFYNDSTSCFLNDIKNIYGTSETVKDTTTAEIEKREGLLKLKNINNTWWWVNSSDSTIAGMGYETESGNITIDSTENEYFRINSVYIGATDILNITGEEGINFSESAWFGSGNSNPYLRIIYRTPEKVQCILSTEANFDDELKALNSNVIFNAVTSWDTLLIPLNSFTNYQSNAKELFLERLRVLY
ncbi:MAG: sulfatase-like hydrolase/transferase, partial [Draconibacterium sp.]|nr:sulfatase-like hydrolase/transferase [Draconibacterium sp.]